MYELRRLYPLALIAIALMVFGAMWQAERNRRAEPGEESEGGPYPSDWFGMQRAFPGDQIPQEKMRAAFQRAIADRAALGLELNATGLDWQQAGPYNIGGRVTALAVVPGAARSTWAPRPAACSSP